MAVSSKASYRTLLEPSAALLRRPDLWLTAGRSARDLAPDGWWRRPPFLPLPDRTWLKMRLVTAYGGDGSQGPTAEDLVTWLEWRKNWPHDH